MPRHRSTSAAASHRDGALADRAARVGDQTGLVADRDELERGFRRLTTDQRAVLVLHYFAGMSVPELAASLQIPLGTAQSRLGRALAALRQELASGRNIEGEPLRGGQTA